MVEIVYNFWVKLILKSRDFFSFFAGMVINGFVIGLSLSEGRRFYIGAILCGIITGLVSYCIVKVCSRYEEKLITNKNNHIPDQNRPEETPETITIEIITNKKEYNKVFGVYHSFWILLGPVIIATMGWLGINFLSYANNEINTVREEKENDKQNVLIDKIDSVLNYHSQDSIIMKSVDSLNRHIHILDVDLKILIEAQKKK